MPPAPAFADTSLAGVVPSAASALGVPGFTDAHSLGTASHVVLLLVDGLGFGAMERANPGWLREGVIRCIESVFPTTTSVALTSVGTGLLPGTHGMIAASFLLPETHEILAPLHWGANPVPEAVQVEPTVFESMMRDGVECHSIGPVEYAHSGLTRASLRGPIYVAASTPEDYAAALEDAVSTAERSFTYAYWPELDRVGHGFGVESREWGEALDRVGSLVSALRRTLPPGSILAMTADHGMVECPSERRIQWEDLRALHADVRYVTGEPRTRMIYLHPGTDVQAVAERWRDRLGEDFQVWNRSEMIATDLWGPTDAYVHDRIGDLVVTATSDRMISCPAIDPRISSLPGQHGAWSREEREIPLVVWREP